MYNVYRVWCIFTRNTIILKRNIQILYAFARVERNKLNIRHNLFSLPTAVYAYMSSFSFFFVFTRITFTISFTHFHCISLYAHSPLTLSLSFFISLYISLFIVRFSPLYIPGRNIQQSIATTIPVLRVIHISISLKIGGAKKS